MLFGSRDRGRSWPRTLAVGLELPVGVLGSAEADVQKVETTVKQWRKTKQKGSTSHC